MRITITAAALLLAGCASAPYQAPRPMTYDAHVVDPEGWVRIVDLKVPSRPSPRLLVCIELGTRTNITATRCLYDDNGRAKWVTRGPMDGATGPYFPDEAFE